MSTWRTYAPSGQCRWPANPVGGNSGRFPERETDLLRQVDDRLVNGRTPALVSAWKVFPNLSRGLALDLIERQPLKVVPITLLRRTQKSPSFGLIAILSQLLLKHATSVRLECGRCLC